MIDRVDEQALGGLARHHCWSRTAALENASQRI